MKIKFGRKIPEVEAFFTYIALSPDEYDFIFCIRDIGIYAIWGDRTHGPTISPRYEKGFDHFHKSHQWREVREQEIPKDLMDEIMAFVKENK